MKIKIPRIFLLLILFSCSTINDKKSYKYEEFSKYEIDSVSDDKIQELINTHKLDMESLKNEYSEKYFKKVS